VRRQEQRAEAALQEARASARLAEERAVEAEQQRVVAVDTVAERITVARNGEANRVVALSELLGRGILNTR
jgi:hypothetical protein